MIDAILLHEGRHPDPFALLGCHGCGKRAIVRVFLPGAQRAWLVDVGEPLQRLADSVATEGADAGMKRLAFAPDGSLIAMTGRGDEIAKAGGSL
ncbi:MAG: hypothetical protein LAE24_02280, partial [Candidatus Contendobacter sp.]|nr:hypothetical protein [Candidatus Contendobacter sp.]